MDSFFSNLSFALFKEIPVKKYGPTMLQCLALISTFVVAVYSIAFMLL